MASAVEQKGKNMFVPICITQFVCVAIILITILITKFFFTNNWQKIRKFCIDNVLEKTKITAQFDEDQS